MKIAIPTNDKVTVSNSLTEAHWFLIFEFKSEQVTDVNILENSRYKNSDMRLNKLFEQLGKLLADCDVIMVHENDPVDSDLLTNNRLKEVRTREGFITNAVINQNTRMVRYNSNRCCSP